jgi:deoxyribose-phosphate aldolase
MYQAVQGRCLVKAAGGIREIREVLAYLEAGARRFGSTRTEQLVRGFEELSPEERGAFAAYLTD